VKPVKDFVVILFFVALGTLLTFSNFMQQLKLILLLLLAAILVKPILIFMVRKVFTYNNRISFLVSIGLAQISEFSLILAMAGVAQGSIAPEFITGAVIATLISMMLTAYFIRYDEQLYQFFKPMLAPVEQVFGLRPDEHHHAHEKYKPQVIILGVNAISVEAIEALHGKKNILVIEKDPARVIIFKERGVHTICTDAYNQDLYDELVDFSGVETVVSVIEDLATNIYFARKTRELNKSVSIIAVAHTEDQGKKLYRAGVTLALVPDIARRRLLSELLDAPDAKAVHEAGKTYYAELQKHFVYRREL
jgi:Kef-type K+ transport system membrane component KefB